MTTPGSYHDYSGCSVMSSSPIMDYFNRELTIQPHSRTSFLLPQNNDTNHRHTENSTAVSVDDIARGFLHNHKGMEDRLNIDNNHVIVDKEDWVEVRSNKYREKFNIDNVLKMKDIGL